MANLSLPQRSRSSRYIALPKARWLASARPAPSDVAVLARDQAQREFGHAVNQQQQALLVAELARDLHGNWGEISRGFYLTRWPVRRVSSNCARLSQGGLAWLCCLQVMIISQEVPHAQLFGPLIQVPKRSKPYPSPMFLVRAGVTVTVASTAQAAGEVVRGSRSLPLAADVHLPKLMSHLLTPCMCPVAWAAPNTPAIMTRCNNYLPRSWSAYSGDDLCGTH